MSVAKIRIAAVDINASDLGARIIVPYDCVLAVETYEHQVGDPVSDLMVDCRGDVVIEPDEVSASVTGAIMLHNRDWSVALKRDGHVFREIEYDSEQLDTDVDSDTSVVSELKRSIWEKTLWRIAYWLLVGPAAVLLANFMARRLDWTTPQTDTSFTDTQLVILIISFFITLVLLGAAAHFRRGIRLP